VDADRKSSIVFVSSMRTGWTLIFSTMRERGFIYKEEEEKEDYEPRA
jgi:hypothetical protein